MRMLFMLVNRDALHVDQNIRALVWLAAATKRSEFTDVAIRAESKEAGPNMAARLQNFTLQSLSWLNEGLGA